MNRNSGLTHSSWLRGLTYLVRRRSLLGRRLDIDGGRSTRMWKGTKRNIGIGEGESTRMLCTSGRVFPHSLL